VRSIASQQIRLELSPGIAHLLNWMIRKSILLARLIDATAVYQLPEATTAVTESAAAT